MSVRWIKRVLRGCLYPKFDRIVSVYLFVINVPAMPRICAFNMLFNIYAFGM